ncbi:hypothetical protein F53441_13459 [Fusarium austroafricanum]|uniref:Uncharacterized protein n=1 Tax=Fusarium austroafricanum TaxID=2364996 RepID=A0A8H4JP29_9HYPO|nr:hypothetical protein F53441_13459 [Fusarium austroafricanum]
MGGKAFTHGKYRLETPRMPREVYLYVKNQVIRDLTETFRWIDTPIEAPGKTDFGDIDVFVSQGVGCNIDKNYLIGVIENAIGAEYKLVEPGKDRVAGSFAIPWPDELPLPPGYNDDDDAGDDESSPRLPTPPPRRFFPPGGPATGMVEKSKSAVPYCTAGPPVSTGPSNSKPTPQGDSEPGAQANCSKDAKGKGKATDAAAAGSQTQPSSDAADGASITQSELSSVPSAATAPPTSGRRRSSWFNKETFGKGTFGKGTFGRRTFSKGAFGRVISGKHTSGNDTFGKGTLKKGRALFSSPRTLSISMLFKRGQSSQESGEFSNNDNDNDDEEDDDGTINTLEVYGSEPEINPGTVKIKRKRPPYKSILLDNPFKRRRRLYIQVDVRWCIAYKHCEFLRFVQSHGDMWQILGSIIRPFGLTVDDRALWLRASEIERNNWERSKIQLTSNPNEILRFLGLPIPEYWRPFTSVEAMFNYIANCPMFSVPPDYDVEKVRASARAKDRRRLAQRPVYREWVEVFKPRCRDQGLYTESSLTRDLVKDKAFDAFRIGTQYHQQVREFVYDSQRAKIRKDFIKGNCPVPEGPDDIEGFHSRARTIKAMSEIVLDRVDSSRYRVEAPDCLWKPNGLFDMDRTEAFIKSKMKFVAFQAQQNHEKEQERLKQEQMERGVREEDVEGQGQTPREALYPDAFNYF